jgi:hypothetical protein
VQGIILQISANRGDKINATIVLHTEDNTETLRCQHERLLELQEQQMEMLKSLSVIQGAIDGIKTRLPRRQWLTARHPDSGAGARFRRWGLSGIAAPQ